MRVSLSEAEYNLLKLAAGKVSAGRRYTTEELARLLGVPRSTVEALVSLLAEKGVVSVSRVARPRARLTDLGREYLRDGLPEEKLVRLLEASGGALPLDEVSRRLGADASAAVAHALRWGAVRIEGGRVELAKPGFRSPDRALLEKVAAGEELAGDELRRLKRRKLVDVKEERVTVVVFRADPRDVLREAVVEVGALTADMIRSGEWRRVRLRPYDVRASPPRLAANKPHAFVEFLEMLRDVMKELGFVEIEYPPVELEFWNYDVLFQPQFHPARGPNDTFYAKGVAADGLEPPTELIERVKAVHEEAWGYAWDPRLALRVILRSHTTAASVRALAAGLKPPFRVFTIGRVYRVEKVDPRHLPEFHQLDGIASEGYDTDFGYLLGIVSEILERLGFKEYKFRLAYFPFTEPSAEGYVRIRGEWVEVLGCGMFRPEVLRSLGIDYPVAAWGMGLERMAMALMGLNDIRDLYSTDAHRLEELVAPW